MINTWQDNVIKFL